MSKVIQRIICNTISEKTECVENLKRLGYMYADIDRESYHMRSSDHWAVCICDNNTYILSNINGSSSDLSPVLRYKEWKQRMINERGVLPYSEPTLQELLDKFDEDMYNRGYIVNVTFSLNR